MAYGERQSLSRGMIDALWEVMFRLDIAERNWRLEEFKRETGGG